MLRRRTKIVATVGPASESPEMLRKLLKAGVDVARLNFSHGTWEEHALRIRHLRAISEAINKPLAILQDLSGPKIRIDKIADEPVILRRGREFTLTVRPVSGDEKIAAVSVPELLQAIRAGNIIYLDDGLLQLKVLRIQGEDIVCRVLHGGPLSSHKGVNLPGASLPLPSLTGKDRADLNFGIAQGVDWIALSFVRSAEDIRQIKSLVAAQGADIPVLAKIEKHEAIRHLDEILQTADGAMVARGDLGIEVPMQEVPLLQKRIIAKCNELGKPVITATQMLDSMVRSPRPTRAEVADIANAIFDGTDAVMLSGETAIGAYPLEAVRTMARVVAEAEKSLDYIGMLIKKVSGRAVSCTDAIGQAACELAMDLKAAAIIAPTTSGQTARTISKYRPEARIVAPTADTRVLRRLALYWGVHPILMRPAFSTDELLSEAISAAVREQMVRKGDRTVLTAGVPAGEPGRTNLIKVHVVGEMLT